MVDALRRAVGLADACELVSALFSFPDERLADALCEGSALDDARGCLVDAGCAAGEGSFEAIAGLVGLDAEALLSRLRRGYSVLYLAPGSEVPVWPYESAFRFVAEGHGGVPSLFRSARQIDVERHMREAGVLPKNARKEPADSVWDELSFMSYLYGSFAEALHEGREADAAEWSRRVVRFWDEHASCWMPAFMEKTIEEAPRHAHGSEYAALAEAGLLLLDAIRSDVDSRRVGA